MSTIRQQVRDRAIDELNAARAPEIPTATKRRWIPGSSSCPPGGSVGVFFIDEDIKPTGGRHGPLVERSLRIAVQCVAVSGTHDGADDLVEPMTAHAVERLGKTNLNGLALDITEHGTQWDAREIGGQLHIAATVVFGIQFSTKRNDLSAQQ